jgi:hypothetical protein
MRWLLLRLSLFLARNGHGAMSAVRSLSGGEQTSRLRVPTSEIDPTRTSYTAKPCSSIRHGPGVLYMN